MKKVNLDNIINLFALIAIDQKHSLTTCKPGKTALLMADSKSIPRTGSFLKKIIPPLGPLKDWQEIFVSLDIHKIGKSNHRTKQATQQNQQNIKTKSAHIVGHKHHTLGKPLTTKKSMTLNVFVTHFYHPIKS